jgi:hypothetical protein
MAEHQKPKRLQFKTYLQMIHNSVGTEMFRNWYVTTPEGDEFDAMSDGEDSCAFYVSGLLRVFGKLSLHGTVESTVQDLGNSGWQNVDEPSPGDVLVWEAQKFGDKQQRHIGFYIGDGKAVSTSWTKKVVVEHDKNFGKQNRKIEQIFRLDDWDDKS